MLLMIMASSSSRSYGMLLYNLFYRVIPSVLVMDQGGGTSDMLYYAMEVRRS